MSDTPEKQVQANDSPTPPDIGSSRLQLRSDIRSSLQKSSGEPFVMLEDLLQSRFYRLGTREWDFIRLLDGKRTLRDVVREYTNQPDPSKLEANDILTLCSWMLQSGLLHGGKTCAVPPERPQSHVAWLDEPNVHSHPYFQSRFIPRDSFAATSLDANTNRCCGVGDCMPVRC